MSRSSVDGGTRVERAPSERRLTLRRRLPRAAEIAALALLAAAVAWTGCDRTPARPNIVIIVLDTVRRDHTGVAREGTSATPVLDGLAAEGTTFTNVWANGPWTVPSHASMFSGLLPSSHKCTGHNHLFRTTSPTFAERLRDEGYETAAFYSNPWLGDKLTGMLRGFEQFAVDPEDEMEVFHRGDQGGSRTAANVQEWLAERAAGRPFLMFVNLLEPHLPYDPPEEYRRTHLPDLRPDDVFKTAWALEFNAGILAPERVDFERLGRLYAGDVSTADGYLGTILDALNEHVDMENTVVVVTSDHGENLGDHGFMDHQFGLFETLIEVPLVVLAPGLIPPGRRDDPAMLSDLYDTVLDVAGVAEGPDTPHSRSLAGPPARPDRPMISEYTGANARLIEALKELNPDLDTSRVELAFSKVRVGSVELTVASDGSRTLYDVAADPLRTKNLADERPGLVNVLLDVMPVVELPPGTELEIDEEMRERLRSLGYIR
ncbi:MAG: sulfatase [Candidatus Eisenbacteria bacterium]